MECHHWISVCAWAAVAIPSTASAAMILILIIFFSCFRL